MHPKKAAGGDLHLIETDVPYMEDFDELKDVDHEEMQQDFLHGVKDVPAAGGRTFENGDITYCEAHHNMAIFCAQTDHPDLSVDVIPIGKVTSDLSVFENLGSPEEIRFSLQP